MQASRFMKSLFVLFLLLLTSAAVLAGPQSVEGLIWIPNDHYTAISQCNLAIAREMESGYPGISALALTTEYDICWRQLPAELLDHFEQALFCGNIESLFVLYAVDGKKTLNQLVDGDLFAPTDSVLMKRRVFNITSAGNRVAWQAPNGEFLIAPSLLRLRAMVDAGLGSGDNLMTDQSFSLVLSYLEKIDCTSWTIRRQADLSKKTRRKYKNADGDVVIEERKVVVTDEKQTVEKSTVVQSKDGRDKDSETVTQTYEHGDELATINTVLFGETTVVKNLSIFDDDEAAENHYQTLRKSEELSKKTLETIKQMIEQKDERIPEGMLDKAETSYEFRKQLNRAVSNERDGPVVSTTVRFSRSLLELALEVKQIEREMQEEARQQQNQKNNQK